MEIKITGRHLEVTEPLKAFTQTKLARLERHFDQLLTAHVIFTLEKNLHKVEAVIHVPGGELLAHSEAPDMYQAIDLLVDKLDRQLVKYKEKMKTHHFSSSLTESLSEEQK